MSTNDNVHEKVQLRGNRLQSHKTLELPKRNNVNSPENFGCSDGASSTGSNGPFSTSLASRCYDSDQILSSKRNSDIESIPKPKNTLVSSNLNSNAENKWAFLQENQFQVAYVSTFYSPNIFYIQNFSKL